MPSVAETDLARTQSKSAFNGHSMVGVLHRAIVCSPLNAGWSQPEQASCWSDLGFLHAPDVDKAEAQHKALCNGLKAADVDIVDLPPAPDLTLDAVYVHDASLTTDFGMILMHPGKINRRSEHESHEALSVSLGIPTLGRIAEPGTAEAGDIVWLDAQTLLVGRGYRTNSAGIEQMQCLLAPKGVEVLSAPLPHASGPSACLHLMSLISLLDEKTLLADLSLLAVETVELLHTRGYRFIEIDDSERATLACNVLALGAGRLLAIEENSCTNERLRCAGFDVRTFPGSEICINGGGGPTCLTRPLLRG